MTENLPNLRETATYSKKMIRLEPGCVHGGVGEQDVLIFTKIRLTDFELRDGLH
jgi:hypothetical protein